MILKAKVESKDIIDKFSGKSSLFLEKVKNFGKIY